MNSSIKKMVNVVCPLVIYVGGRRVVVGQVELKGNEIKGAVHLNQGGNILEYLAFNHLAEGEFTILPNGDFLVSYLEEN
jgi:hypothetical protein